MGRFTLRLVIILLLGVALSLAGPCLVCIAEGPEAEYALGLLPSPEEDYPRLTLDAAAGPLPPAVDLSGGMPSVGNQGRQASCVGWAIAYYCRSYQEGVENHRSPAQTDELFSPAYIYNQRSDKSRDVGMSMVSGLRIAVGQGVATLSAMPYNAADSTSQPSAEAHAEAALYRSLSYFNLFTRQGSANLLLLKQHLAKGGVLLLAVPIYSEFYRVNSYNPIIGAPAAGSTYYGGHAVTVIGYDDAAKTFKFVNSWGRGWGDYGYAYLTYDFVQRYAWEAWVLMDSDTTPPKLPERAQELGGAENGVAQGEISTPVFAWEASADPTARYQVYWGPAANGTGNTTVTEAIFSAPAVSQTSTLYLRVRALDGVGNATSWRTLFTFCYVAQSNGEQSLIAQSLAPNPPPAPGGSR